MKKFIVVLLMIFAVPCFAQWSSSGTMMINVSVATGSAASDYLRVEATDLDTIELNGYLGENFVRISDAGSQMFAIDTSGNVIVIDNAVIGLAATLSGRIEFDDQTTDEINLLNANIGIGTTTPDDQVEIVKAAANAVLDITAYHDTEATTALLAFRKADNTEAAPALVDDNAVLGTITARGYDGVDFVTEGARIQFIVDGTPEANQMPADIEFYTAAGSAANDVALSMTLNSNRDLNLGGAVADQITPDFTILGDADSDGSATTSETFTLALTGNATPTSAVWDITSTQSAGYRLDKSLTVGLATPNETLPTFSIRGDADSDAGDDVTDALAVVLTPNATPTSATWGFTSTQSAGYTFDKNVQSGISGVDGKFTLYSEQGATDYSVSLNPNSAMTSAALFYLPADEPAAQSLVTSTTAGVLGYAASSADLAGNISDETGTGLLVYGTAPTLASTVTIGTNAGTSGQINFIASDNDQANISINTSDQIVVSAASGGFAVEDYSLIVNNTVADAESPDFILKNDFDSDGTAFTSDAFTISSTANANPTLGTWNITSTQGAGYTFDKTVTLVTLSTTNVGSSLAPSADATHDLGSVAAGWDSAWVDDLDVDGTLTVVGISTVGNVIPSADASKDLGSASAGWDSVWVDDLDVDGTLIVVGASTFTGVGTFNGGIVIDDSLQVGDDDYIGLDGGGARIQFDNQATDEINFLNANIGIKTSAPMHDISLYETTPWLVLTDTDANFDLSSAAEAIDSASVYIEADGTPSFGLRGTDGDAMEITLNTSDAMLFANASGGYSFDAVGIFTTAGIQIPNTSTAPGPLTGQMYYQGLNNTDADTLFVYNGTAWKAFISE